MSNEYTQPPAQSNITYSPTNPGQYPRGYYPYTAVYSAGPPTGPPPALPTPPNDIPPYKQQPPNVSQQHPPAYSPQVYPLSPPTSPPIGPIPQPYGSQFAPQPPSNTPFPPSSPSISKHGLYSQYHNFPQTFPPSQPQNFLPIPLPTTKLSSSVKWIVPERIK